MTPPPAPQPGPPPSAPADAGLAAFLAGWFRASQAGRLYGIDHPVVRDAAAQAAAALAELPAPASVVVLPHGFEHAGQPVAGDGFEQPLEALSATLHDLDIRSVELAPGLSAAEAQATALALGQASDQPAAERVNQAAAGRLSLRAVTYRGLQVRDVAPAGPTEHAAAAELAPGEPPSRAAIWSRLNTGILDPTPDAADPGQLARQIGAQVAADPNAALAGLGRSLVGSARALAQRPADQQHASLDRMRSLLGGLGPELRASLERVAAAAPQPAARPATPPGDNAMAQEIAGALTRGQSAGAGISPEALMLCQKLADLPFGPPAPDASDASDDDSSEGNPAQAMGDALETLFSRIDPAEFTPDDYQSQIRGTLNRPAPDGPRPGVDRAFSTAALGIRCAQIARDLLEGETGQASPALQQVIAKSVIPLIDTCEFSVLADRLRFGDAALTLALGRDDVIDRVLAADASDRTGDHHAVITGLLNHAGDRAVDRITRRLLSAPPPGDDTPPVTGPAAERVLAAANAVTRGGALRRGLADIPGPLPAVAARLLTCLAFSTATELLKTRLNAAEPSDRHAAYTLLAHAIPVWPARFVSQALRDRNPGVQHRVLDRLSAGRDARHLALTKLVLEGHSAAGLLSPIAFDQLVRGTLDRGVEGRWVAAQVLRTLCRSVNPRRAARGARLARRLAGHRDDPAVQWALRLWRLAPARWAARLAPSPAAVPVAPDPPAATPPAAQPRTAA